MILKWDKEARQLVDATARHIEEQDGSVAGVEFLEEVLHVIRLLPLVPYLGPMERLLYRSKVKFRSIVVCKYNKIIYYVRQDEIVIVDFWDTRMNPKTLVQRLQNKL